jgi:hypothetical protein
MMPYQQPTSPVPQTTNACAIISLVCALVGFGSLPAIIFGLIANNQIQQSHGTQRGYGLAFWGILLGMVELGGTIIIIAVLLHNSH